MIKIKLINPTEKTMAWGTYGGPTKSTPREFECDSYEIIDEDKKIEKLSNNLIFNSEESWIDVFVIKINELVDAVNKLMDKK
jgi:hypothetical protein